MTEKATRPPYEFLEWDTSFFGFRIGRLQETAVTVDTMATSDTWAKTEHIDCIYALADSTDAQSIRFLETGGYHLVNIKTILDTPFERTFLHVSPGEGIEVRRCEEHDLAPLMAMAQINHHHSRFFTDPHFNPRQSGEMFSRWIELCYRDPETTVFTACCNNKPAGYIACKIAADRIGSIALAGVSSDFRNRGIGTQLVQTARDWFSSHGAKGASVVTQGGNIQALRLYTSMGFYPRSVHLWYHKWFI